MVNGDVGRVHPVVEVAFRLVDALVVPVGVGLAVGLTLAQFLEPRWSAGGLVYILQYPKNVEVTATLVGLLAAGLTGALTRLRLVRWPLYALALAGWIVAATRVVGLEGWALPAVLLALTATGLVASEQRGEPLAALAGTTMPVRVRAALIGVILVLACGVAFLKGLTPSSPLDVFHDGEVLVTAEDFLDGGRPFETVMWPHGLHDTGLTALWASITDKVGSLSSATLAQASTAALGPITVFLIALTVLPARVAAALALGLALLTPAGVAPLSRLGRIPFAAAALALTSRPSPTRWHFLAAGGAAGLQHLFRIEAGLFTLAAVGVVAAWWATVDAEGIWNRILLAVRSGSAALAGFGMVMGTSWLILGWPGRGWYEWVLEQLPVYHRDANGLPMPWPTSWSQAAPEILDRYAVPALMMLAITAILLAAGARRATSKERPGPRLTAWLLFVAVFAWQGSRTVLGRSDAHVTTWAPLLALVMLCVIVRGAWVMRGRMAAGLALAVGVLLLDLNVLTLSGPQVLAATARDLAPAEVSDQIEALREHLAPNPPDRCGDHTFTASQLKLERNALLAEASCELDGILRRADLRRILFVHSAPWYAVRFETGLPSRFYTLLRAYSPDMQEELIANVREEGLDAVLRVRGFGALNTYNHVPDGFHVPMVAAYLIELLQDAEVVHTGLGALHLVAPRAEPAEPAGQVGLGSLRVGVDHMVFDEQSGFLWAQGWALDAGGQPLVSMEAGCPERCGSLTTALPTPSTAPAANGRRPARAGWELSVFLVDDRLPVLRLVPATGPVGGHPLDLSAATRLPGRTGPEWIDLRERVREMMQLGRDDRKAFASTTR